MNEKNRYLELVNQLKAEAEVIQNDFKLLADEYSQKKEQKEAIQNQISELRQQMSNIEAEMAKLEQEMRKLKAIADFVGITLIGYEPIPAKTTTVRKTGKKLRDPKTGQIYNSYADACRAQGIEYGAASAHQVWVRKMGYDLEETE